MSLFPILAAVALIADRASPEIPPAPAAPALGTTADETPMGLLFLFARARYFYDRAKETHCEHVQPERTRALDLRYRKMLDRLTARYGSGFKDLKRSGPLPPSNDPGCAMGVALIGYDHALGDLDREMAKAAVP
jgi:hypothetical protein